MVVAFEGVVLCMSERYALVCYSCNKLLPFVRVRVLFLLVRLYHSSSC